MSVSHVSVTFALVRLAEEARRRELQLFLEEATGSWFCTSHRAPDRLYRVTAVSCTCKGFLQWGRCTHMALLNAELGYLPDDDPQPPVALSASSPTGEEPAPAAFSLSPAVTVMESPVVPPPIPVTVREDRAAVMEATIDGAIERLALQLEAGHTEEFRQVLQFYSRFHTYSWANSLLIRIQCPEATLVAGMKRWNELGYHVRKGERAIYIWAPIVRSVEDPDTGDKMERLTGFRPAPVFDASQLANLADKPLPALITPLPDDATALYRQVRDRIVQHGIVVEETRLPGGVYGTSAGGVIQVSSAIDSRQRLLVLLHELTHELAHHGDTRAEVTREQRELEAESVSYIVGLVLGIENPNSRDYIVNWKGSAEQLRASLGTVQRLVRQVLRIVQPDGQGGRRAA